jgi:hypothetical protein
MLVVMLALLGASLGFAEVLVKRQKPSIVITAQFAAPPGVKDLPVNDSMDEAFNGPLKTAMATWNAGPRTFVAYSFDGDWNRPLPLGACLGILSQQLVPDEARPNFALMANIASVPALEQRFIVPGEDAHFVIIRATIIENGRLPPHVVAFAFSGPGNFTETDNRFFQDYCTKSIKISTQLVQP